MRENVPNEPLDLPATSQHTCSRHRGRRPSDKPNRSYSQSFLHLTFLYRTHVLGFAASAALNPSPGHTESSRPRPTARFQPHLFRTDGERSISNVAACPHLVCTNGSARDAIVPHRHCRIRSRKKKSLPLKTYLSDTVPLHFCPKTAGDKGRTAG